MKTRAVGELFITFFCGVLLLSGMPARGDADVYWDYDNGFDPSTVVIGPGEKVTWWNYDPYGFSVHISIAGGPSFTLAQYHGAYVTFSSTPNVYYFTSDWGDSGYVIVNVAPSVSITNPANNAVFSSPAAFPVEAITSDTADDYVSDVQFFLGTSDATNAIDDVFSPPFTTTVTNLDAGTYSLIAIATDSRGWTATNAITITVAAPATVSLGSPRVVAGKFLFNLSGLTVGKTNILLASTNLLSWTPIKTNIATSATMTATNTPTARLQYFSIVQLP